MAAFLAAYLEGSAGPSDAVAVALALARGRAGDLPGLLDLDVRLDALRPAAEMREASRQMGRQTLRVGAAVTGDALLLRMHEAADSGHTPGHHPVVFGAVGAVLGWTTEAASLAYLHTATALVVGAALRLPPLGQLEGQRLLSSVRPLIIRLARTAANATLGDLWGFTPGIDAASMRHAGLEARLFRS